MPKSRYRLPPGVRPPVHASRWGNNLPGPCTKREKDSDRIAFSRRNAHQSPLAIRGESEAGPNVFVDEVWKVVQDLIFSHPGSQVVQNVVDCDPHTADARLPAHLAGLDCNDLAVIHTTRSRVLSSTITKSGLIGASPVRDRA